MTKRKRDGYESPALTGAVRRFHRALVRRAGEGDAEALEGLLALQADLDAAVVDAGRALHEFGYSYTYLGGVMGTTRQNARARFAPRPLPVGGE